MNRKLLSLFLLLFLIVGGATSAWADEVTYTFNSKAWGDSENEWTSGKDGNALTSDRGVQVTTGASGANATTKTDLSNVTKVVVTYSTNASKGAGSVSIQVGSNDETSKSVTTTGGTTDRTLEYTFASPQSGAVKITVTCSTNSIYIKSVAITYGTVAPAACATPTFSPAAGTYYSAQNVEISTTTEGATIYYTTNGDTPTSSSTEYTGAISVSTSQTIKAIAVKDGNSDSEVATAEYIIDTTPSISVAETTIEAPAEGQNGTKALTYRNLTIDDASDFDVQFYESESAESEADAPDWIEVEITEENGDYFVSYTIVENISTDPRTAYFKVYALDNETLIYSNLVTVTQAGALPKYTVTFSDGGSETQALYEAAVTLPSRSAIGGYTFAGWSETEVATETTSAQTTIPAGSYTPEADITLYPVYKRVEDGGVSSVVDELNRAWTGISGTNYSGWTDKTVTSSAVYAGNSAGGNEAIQLRSNNSNSGIVTTTSGGKATKVVVSWNSETADGRTVDVYGKNSAYSAASDLYNTSNQGTKLGSIVNGTSTELTISGDYEYIGLRSSSGAMYLDKVEITWSSGSSTTYYVSAPAQATLNDEDGITALASAAGRGCVVTYTRSFTEGKASTVCLPFDYTKKDGDGSFYEFTGIEQDGEGEYVAIMTEPVSTTLEAKKPYLYLPDATGDVNFGGTYAIPSDLTAGSYTSGDWTFKGTFETIEWASAPAGTYGFSAQNANGISQGEFVKVGNYVRIKPMRCYLQYIGDDSQWAGVCGKNRVAAKLPETIKVRLVGADGTVTAIGSLSTTTGEMTMDGAWYSINGTRLNGTPATKGIYVRNGKKVVIK